MVEASYGTIPYSVVAGAYKFLVIHMYGSAGGTHWTFPKGRPEPNETPVVTAIRETKEEVGLDVVIQTQFNSLQHSYTFVRAGELVSKKVEYFLATSDTVALTIQPEEIKEARWCDAHEVLLLLTHESSKQLFKKALQLLDIVV